MSFSLTNDCKNWFKEVAGKHKFMDFDIFYFCYISGILSKKRNSLEGVNSEIFSKTFIEKYKDKSSLLISLLLTTEIERFSIDKTSKKEVNRFIESYLDINATNRMSNLGIKTMNEYSYGGYIYLSEKMYDKPRSIETFLLDYYSLINKI